jgi:hypothetical protein
MCEDFALNFGDKNWLLHQRFHFSSGNFFTKNNMTIVVLPPYISLMIKLEVRHFDAIEVIEAE